MIGVVFTDEKIVLAELSNNNKNLPEIKKLAQLDLGNFELINLAIFNQTKISKFINNFISINKLQNFPVIFCLDGSKLKEFHDKPDCTSKINCDCRTCIIYTTSKSNLDDKDYYCQISYPILFQYKLLALNLKLNLISIVTDIVAINELLNHEIGKKKAFRDNIKKKFLKKQDLYAQKQLLGLSFIINKN